MPHFKGRAQRKDELLRSCLPFWRQLMQNHFLPREILRASDSGDHHVYLHAYWGHRSHRLFWIELSTTGYRTPWFADFDDCIANVTEHLMSRSLNVIKDMVRICMAVVREQDTRINNCIYSMGLAIATKESSSRKASELALALTKWKVP